MEKTCFFIGHRDAPDSLAPELDALVERHITEYGVGELERVRCSCSNRRE